MNPKKWSIENRVCLEAETYEQAVSKFWDLMEKANIGSIFNAQPTQNCFVGNAQSGKRGPEMDSEAEAIDAAMAQGEK